MFDIKVNSLSPSATLTVKIDSGYPNLGQVALSPSQYSVGSWRRVAINFADSADPARVRVSTWNNVVNAFVIEVTGGNADFYLDNIFISHACPDVDGCRPAIRTKPGTTDSDGDGVERQLTTSARHAAGQSGGRERLRDRCQRCRQ